MTGTRSQQPRALLSWLALGGLGLCGSTLTGALGGCAPEPFILDEINLEGVPVERGALVGTFAVKSVASTVVAVPIPGIEDEMGGGEHYGLIVREWDEAAGAYLQRTRLCGGVNYEVHGTVVYPEDATYLKVPESTDERVEVQHDTGQYVAQGHVQLWALRDLPDPERTPLPTSLAQAGQAPHQQRIYDMDGDGHPGYTTHVEGLVNGDAYTILRKRVGFEGVTLSPDRVLGLNDTSYDSLLLGSDNDMVDGLFEGTAEKWPDPAHSWFEEVRAEDGVDCADVLRMVDEEVLSRVRPF